MDIPCPFLHSGDPMCWECGTGLSLLLSCFCSRCLYTCCTVCSWTACNFLCFSVCQSCVREEAGNKHLCKVYSERSVYFCASRYKWEKRSLTVSSASQWAPVTNLPSQGSCHVLQCPGISVCPVLRAFIVKIYAKVPRANQCLIINSPVVFVFPVVNNFLKSSQDINAS